MGKISFNTNNGATLDVIQYQKDGIVYVKSENSKNIEISAGDMVMLLNYYRYIKENDIQCDFINPYGKN